VAERLAYRYVDDEVIEQAGEWADLAPAFVAEAERRKPLMDRMFGRLAERPPTPGLVATQAGRSLPSDSDLQVLIKQVLASIAEEGSVVIVSHAASFALTGEGVLRVMVTASAETRARRLLATKNVDSRAAVRLVKQEDAGRADYLKRFYAIERELPTHFDLVVNTDVLTSERAAEVVVAATGLRAGR
jgi:cytidylate kinase